MPRKTVGIDIGSYSIKLVELEHRKTGIAVTKSAFYRIKDNDVKSSLKGIINSSKFLTKRVAISLSGPSVIVRYIDMPVMKQDELKSAIKFEAEKYLPFNIKDSIVDCAVLAKTSTGTMKVVLVAAKSSEVTGLLNMFKELKLEVGIVGVDGFALFNCFEKFYNYADKDKAYALINIGDKFSNVNIGADDGASFTRDILWGGNDITSRIKDALDMDYDEAEKLKFSPSERKDEVIRVTTPVLERFISQVRISFDYFESQSGKGVEKVYLSGGAAYLFNMVDFLKDNLGIDTMIWSPFESINIIDPSDEIKKQPSLFTVAMGLALRK